MRRQRRRALAATLVAVVTLLLAGCGASTVRPGQAAMPGYGLYDRVSGTGAYVHLQALQRIADQNGGIRASGTPGYQASADYVAGVLRDAGFQVTVTDPFPVTRDEDDGDDATVQVRNVIAQTRGGDQSRVIMAGAHLDSVSGGPGIADNGSGVATLLETAVRMGPTPPVQNAVRFAFFGAEEDNDQGSLHYVKTLSSAQRPLMYLNVDMVASSNGGYFYQGGSGGKAKRAGPAGSGAIGQVLADQLRRAGVSGPEAQDFSADSDYEGFVAAGIPSGGLLNGDEDRMSVTQAAKWHGVPGRAFDPCYHSACDTLANIDRTTLDRFTHAVAGTLEHFSLTAQELSQ